jgi:hypothetical protein
VPATKISSLLVPVKVLAFSSPKESMAYLEFLPRVTKFMVSVSVLPLLLSVAQEGLLLMVKMRMITVATQSPPQAMSTAMAWMIGLLVLIMLSPKIKEAQVSPMSSSVKPTLTP